MWCGLGVIAAGFIRLVLWDHSFQVFLFSKYKPSVTFDDPRLYVHYLITIAVTIFIAIFLFIPGFLWRGLKSWWEGVTSGLALLSFGSVFLFLILPSPSLRHSLAAISEMISISFLTSFVLYMRARVSAERIVHEEEFMVPSSIRSVAGTQLSESDDPIQTWAEDALGRAALVDAMTVKLLIGRTPVLALSGEFGSGKTSTLNLLREHLGDKTITISFSTWLPGSQETLTSYLLNDIANECRKQFVVPGLRRSARRWATAMGQNVPLLKNYLELLPAATQRDDIESLKAALTRLPKRVVVLLDEIDRMDKDELITLLKVIRGVATLPNISFVCAGDLRTIVDTVKGEETPQNYAYFEKFFPVLIRIPDADLAALRKAGTKRLLGALNSRDWFERESEAESFREHIETLWDERIAPFCHNLRAIGLFANDVSVAAAPLRREVNPVDLSLIELLRRFKPAVYELVAKNSVTLTGGESSVRGGHLQSEKDRENAEKKLLADIEGSIADADELDQVKGILGELFPLFVKINGHSRVTVPRRKDSEEESEKRICMPGIFPAYFRYELPDAIFSSVEMASLVRRMERADNEANCEKVFLDAFDSMGKGSLKRDDFLRKLVEAAKKSIPLPVGKTLARAAVKASASCLYDILPAFGEAGHVLRIILGIGKRLPQKERVAFLGDCILTAGDDTMAFNILTILTKQKDDSNLEVSVAELYPGFVRRMRNRYGWGVDAAKIDLSTSDPWAFDYWGRDFNAAGITTDPEDRRMQYDFWLRYIGTSRSRLAQTFRKIFLPIAIYSEDPAFVVQNKISITELKRLYEELPADINLTARDRQSLATLRRFLDGEFKNGINPGDNLYGDERVS
jgi:hypothetical protein